MVHASCNPWSPGIRIHQTPDSKRLLLSDPGCGPGQWQATIEWQQCPWQDKTQDSQPHSHTHSHYILSYYGKKGNLFGLIHNWNWNWKESERKVRKVFKLLQVSIVLSLESWVTSLQFNLLQLNYSVGWSWLSWVESIRSRIIQFKFRLSLQFRLQPQASSLKFQVNTQHMRSYGIWQCWIRNARQGALTSISAYRQPAYRLQEHAPHEQPTEPNIDKLRALTIQRLNQR